MQGHDIDKAIHWLSAATNNNLMRLAAKVERFLVQTNPPLSGSKEAVHIPHSSLLKMLDGRQAAINSMQATASRCVIRYQMRASESARYAWVSEMFHSIQPEYPASSRTCCSHCSFENCIKLLRCPVHVHTAPWWSAVHYNHAD